MKIKLIKFRDDLIPPVRAHYNDAGLDCYALKDFTIPAFQKSDIDNVTGEIKFITTTCIGLGFGLEVPDGYVATIRPRSSMNLKGIITYIGTVDSGYRGEIKAAFSNLNKKEYQVKKGDKICQIVIEPVILAEFVDNLQNDRGDKGFGSTGR